MDPAPQPEHAWTPAPEPDTEALPVLSDVDTRPPRPADPFAVALGNASLLGVGYLLLRRTWLAILTLAVTVTLVIVLVESTPAVWLEVVVVLWWAALIAHGWFLARRRPRPGRPWGQRAVALAVTVPVLAAFGVLRFDAAGIEDDVTTARGEGDCRQAVTATDRLGFGHRVVDAPLVARAEETIAACERLRAADKALGVALTGDIEALENGFATLSEVLAERPGHEQMVATALDGFLDRLPKVDSCLATKVTDWLREHKPGGALAPAADIVPRVAPQAMVGCGDRLMAASDWGVARDHYQQLLDEYPKHKLAPTAQQGVRKATLAIELDNVRGLLAPTGGQPRYCDSPAPYSGAAPYVPNRPNRALLFGSPANTEKIPAGWLASDVTNAVVVICAGESEYGAAVDTCLYDSTTDPGVSGWVTFRKIAIPLRIFEVRTGRQVAAFTVEIGGGSCPPFLSWYGSVTPPSNEYVAAGAADVQAAFRPFLIP
jgi:hypothetical protein